MSDGISVRLAAAADADAWNAFVQTRGTFFHRWEWGTLVSETYGHEAVFLLAEENGSLVGILPLIDRRSFLFGRALISVAFTVGGGLVADSDAIRDALLSAALEQAEQRGSEYVELRSPDQAIPGWHPKEGIYDNFAVPLIPDADARLKSIPRKKRADLRKAIKSAAAGDISLEMTEDMGLFWRHYARAQRDHGTPVFPKKWLAHQRAAFGEDMEVCLVRDKTGEPLAGVTTYYHRRTAYLYSSFISAGARRHHAGDYLYWAMMERALDRGAETFDLGRSKRGTGSHAYKTYWGMRPDPMVYQYKLMGTEDVPNVNPQNPKFALMVKSWRQLPLAVANRLGPVLAGHLA